MKIYKLLSLLSLIGFSTFSLSQSGSFYNNDLTPLPDGSGVQYVSSVNISGFSGQQVSSLSDLSIVSLTMEHSYLGDLEFALECPNGTQVTLFNAFDPGFIPGGFGGNATFLGSPWDGADQVNGPGEGSEYKFSSVYNTWGDMPTEFSVNNTVPANLSAGISMNPDGIYLPEESFSSLIGCPLDGQWSIVAQDNLVQDDGYVFSWGIELDASMTGHSGMVFKDFDQDCVVDSSEGGLENITLVINPGDYVVQTNSAGGWSIDSLPVGTYTVTVDTTTTWVPSCSHSQTFTVTDPNTYVQSTPIGMVNLNACPEPDVSINTPIARPCFSTTVFVQARNEVTGTEVISNALIDVELDPTLTITGASEPYNATGANTYQFDIGDLYPGQTVNLSIEATVDCDAVLGQTICNRAELNPVSLCMLDTIPGESETYNPNGQLPEPCSLPWDESSLDVEGWCQNDSVYFEVTNTSEPISGDMDCYTSVMVFADTVLVFADSLLLSGEETEMYAFPATGQTWVMNVPQHPLHPGNSNPTAHVELCGDTSNWVPNIINQYPLDDLDPVVDINCVVLTGSYDPNDKQGTPLGVTDEHRISRGDQLEYLIRFQNTGTDTAFTVVIKDTLDSQLNLFSVVPGASSHNYSFKLLNGSVLEWTFNNILLPDSTTNEEESKGFVTFRVDQVPDLPYGSVIYNDADIYFDFNPPIITNETFHTIYKGYIDVLNVDELNTSNTEIAVYPNPTSNIVNLQVSDELLGESFTMYDGYGRQLEKGEVKMINTKLDLSNYKTGYYILRVGDKNQNVVKLLKW